MKTTMVSLKEEHISDIIWDLKFDFETNLNKVNPSLALLIAPPNLAMQESQSTNVFLNLFYCLQVKRTQSVDILRMKRGVSKRTVPMFIEHKFNVK